MVNIPSLLVVENFQVQSKQNGQDLPIQKIFYKNMSSSNKLKIKRKLIVDLDENIKKYDCVLGNKLLVTNTIFKIIKPFLHFMFNPSLQIRKKKFKVIN